MPLTLEELKQALQSRVDEVSLLEVLDISAEEIVERFTDKIEERYGKLSRDFDTGYEEEEER